MKTYSHLVTIPNDSDTITCICGWSKEVLGGTHEARIAANRHLLAEGES